MRKSIVLTIAAAPLLLGTGVALSTPAAATEIKEAVKLCDANPNCTIRNQDVAGHLVMDVKTSQGDKVVECKQTGPCVAVFKVPGGGKSTDSKTGRKSAGTVATALAKPPIGAVKPAGSLVQSQSKLTSTPSGSGSNLMTGGSATSGTGLKTKQDLGTTTKR